MGNNNAAGLNSISEFSRGRLWTAWTASLTLGEEMNP